MGILASLLFNGALVCGAIVGSQIASARHAAQRAAAELRRHLEGYRMLLLVSPARIPSPPAPPIPPPRRPAPRPLRPLVVPDPRLVDRLDPSLAGFVRDNPAVESVITREIVRDLDSGLLDPKKLLARSSLRVSFEVGEDGSVRRPRIEKSSTVPSIDRLALELAKLVEAYSVLEAVKGVGRVVVAIDVGETAEVRVEGIVRDPAETESVRRQVQNLLALSRFALGQSEGAFLLQDVALEAGDGRVSLRRSFAKQPLLDFLMRCCAQPLK